MQTKVEGRKTEQQLVDGTGINKESVISIQKKID